MDWFINSLQYWLVSFVSILFFQTIIFFYIKPTKRFDVADVIWGPSILVGFLSAVPLYPQYKPVSILLAALVFIWAMRLSWHIYKRFRKKNEMDRRYIKLIGNKPVSLIKVYLKVFVVQSILASVISLTFLPVAYSELNTTAVSIGALIWLFGFIFEVVADRQLASYIKSGHGIMKTGLWNYSRHPNYFGEIVQWWGLWVMTLSTSLSVVSILGPITITYLIAFVSGVPMLEGHMSKKEGWSAYKKSTSAIIPWFKL